MAFWVVLHYRARTGRNEAGDGHRTRSPLNHIDLQKSSKPKQILAISKHILSPAQELSKLSATKGHHFPSIADHKLSTACATGVQRPPDIYAFIDQWNDVDEERQGELISEFESLAGERT